MKGQFYKARRHKLLEKVKDNSVIVLFAGNAPKKTADEAYPFTPNRNFYYLTGVQEPDHILLMSKINGKEKNILFIKDIDLELEKWIGKSLRENEALDIAGVDEVMFKSTFEDIDTYNELSNRVMKEDIFTIVDSTFMPCGVECDQYSVIGEILELREEENIYTGEKIYIMVLECNSLIITTAVNKEHLLGEPAVGRRFKGQIWLQGNVRFTD